MKFIELDSLELAACLDNWHHEHPQMGVFALLPEAEKDRLPLLQDACRARGISLVGAIFPALLGATGFIQHGAWLLRFDQHPPCFLFSDLNADVAPAAERIARQVSDMLATRPGNTPNPTLYLVFDGMLPNIASILEGLYASLADQVVYAGVNAGSETFQPMPCLFDNDQVIDQGVLGILLPGETTTVLVHGYKVPERMMSATSTQGNRIAMIDWRPAFDVYREIIQDEYGIDLTRDNFYQYAVHYPFGILRANQEVIVRIPVAVTEDGSLFCVGEVPENAMLVLLKSPDANAEGCIASLADSLEAVNGSLRGRQLLTFYCAGRRMHLGEDSVDELDILHASTAVDIMGGALTLGEIGSTQRLGYPMFHNATLVCTPWIFG